MLDSFYGLILLASLLPAQEPPQLLARASAVVDDRDMTGEWEEIAPAKTRLEIEGVPLKGAAADQVLELDRVSSWGARLSIVSTDTELEVDCVPVYGGKQDVEQSFWIPVENEDGGIEINVASGRNGKFTWGKKRREAKVRALIVHGGLDIGGEEYVVEDRARGEATRYAVQRSLRLLRGGKLRVMSTVSPVGEDGEKVEMMGKVMVVQTFVRR